jgi:HEAT repeat protein
MGIKDREFLKSILQDRDWDKLLSWYLNNRGAVRILTSLLYDDAPLIRWRAIEAFGLVSQELAKNDMESVRQIIRRFFWGMNDESGNLIRNAPEAIGEILLKVPDLIPDYGFVLASFISEEPFESGVHRAMARMIPEKPKFVNEITDKFIDSLNDDNPAVRGNAAYILASLNPDLLDGFSNKLESDDSVYNEYDFEQGEIIDITVAQRFRQAETISV